MSNPTLDEVILGLENWMDSQHVPSNNGSYRLTPEEAKSAIQALIDSALIRETERNLNFSEEYWQINAYKHFKYRLEQLSTNPIEETK